MKSLSNEFTGKQNFILNDGVYANSNCHHDMEGFTGDLIFLNGGRIKGNSYSIVNTV